ncbi:glycosyltransferase family 4 protein [Butyrivibrio fibrisolvens]|uniref:glycosyltransferase family 4 protein n=1 Tax=Butyrivibrio fibrisolvens TaxID=831 RepID=UPI0003B5269C|nr:glycosyltransferase family 4 protein [Butyrivibrio fibrisolvens]
MAKKNDVLVITHKEESLPEEEIINGIKIIRKYDGNASEYVKCLRDNIGSNDILVNVCVQTPTTDLLLPILDTIKCKKKILYVHGIWHFGFVNRDKESIHNFCSKIYNNCKWYMYYALNAKYFKKYDVITQLHEKDDGNVFFKKHFGINSEIMENAADEAFFSIEDDTVFRKKYDLPTEYLVCVANYSPLKNQEMVLKAYYKANIDTEMVFVGADSNGYVEYLKRMEDYIRTDTEYVENKKVRFIVDVPREEIAKFVRNAKLFLFGSVGEKYPVSIVEAMAAGVPFISTDVGIVKYFPGGIIVNSIEEMAHNISRLVNDKELHDALSKDGAEYARKRMRIGDKVDAFEEICFGSNK